MRRGLLLVVVGLVMGCPSQQPQADGGSSIPPNDASSGSEDGVPDAGSIHDAGGAPDAGLAVPEAGVVDAGAPFDGGQGVTDDAGQGATSDAGGFGDAGQVDVDGGSADGGDTGPCGEVDIRGRCSGSTLEYCRGDGTVDEEFVVVNCASAYQGTVASCGLVSEAYGYDCLVPPGSACRYGSGDSAFTAFCSGEEPGCVFDWQTLTNTCAEDVGVCAPSNALPYCSDAATLVTGCNQVQPRAYECPPGSSCAVDRCIGVPEGGACVPGVFDCAAGLECQGNQCVSPCVAFLECVLSEPQDGNTSYPPACQAMDGYKSTAERCEVLSGCPSGGCSTCVAGSAWCSDWQSYIVDCRAQAAGASGLLQVLEGAYDEYCGD